MKYPRTDEEDLRFQELMNETYSLTFSEEIVWEDYHHKEMLLIPEYVSLIKLENKIYK